MSTTNKTNETPSAAADKSAHSREPALHEFGQDRNYNLRLNNIGESVVVEAIGETVQTGPNGALVCLASDFGQIRRLCPHSYHYAVKSGVHTYELEGELHTGELLNYVARKCDFTVTRPDVVVKRWKLSAECERVIK